MMSVSPNVGSEFRYVHSCDLEFHVQIKICTLEGNLARLNYENLLENPLLKFSGRNQSKFPDLMVETVVKTSKDQKPLHLPVSSAYKSFTKRWEWNEWLNLPIKYSDLPRDADLCLTVFDCSGANVRTNIGSVSLPLFGKRGVFREGQKDSKLSNPSSTQQVNLSTASTDNFQRLGKLTKKYQAGKIAQIDWLDRLTFAEIGKINQKEKLSSNQLFLMIEFPQVQFNNHIHSIVYFEKNANILSDSVASLSIGAVNFPDNEIELENLVEMKHHRLARSQRAGQSEKDLKPNASTRNRLNEIVSNPTTHVLTLEERDLIWQYRYYLSANKKSLAKFVKCVNWKVPNEAMLALDLISKWAPMDVEDALELLGPSFRHSGVRQYAVNRLHKSPDEDLQLYLLQLVQALKYENFSDVGCVSDESEDDADGSSDSNEEQRSNRKKKEINSSSGGEMTNDNQLRNSNQEETIANAQLEDSNTGPSSVSNGNTESNTPDISRLLTAGENNGIESRQVGGLANFLIDRACQNSVLANYFYWYLVIECEEQDNVVQKDEKVREMFDLVLKKFKLTLKKGPSEFRARFQFLERQQVFVDKLVQLVKAVARESGNRKKKIERLQLMLADPDSLKYNFVHFDPLKLPLDPDVTVCGVIPSEATLFKSSLMPARITFITSDDSEEQYVTIFKHGDDLRQDQLILQIITLMDRILQQENLDLKLTPYRVLATSSKHGFVQFVDSSAIADILGSEGSIQNYFRKHNPSESGPYGIAADVMDTYVKSCAGYCVITYLLGVGDRHLDNLLLTRSGKLFHIDFGYILGRDPKPMPPPMKLSKEMIEAFGGMTSDHYHQFRKECYTAFLSLRRYANLILNLFSLMVDASVPDIALEPDKTVRKVQDKFRLDLNDEEAVHYMQSLIDVSATAVMAAIVERIHKFAQFWRN